MSSVDKRIVDVQFNNKQFEAGIKETSNSLKKFDENLSADRSGISRNLDYIADKFTILGTMGRRAIENITDSVMGLGRNLANQFVFQPKTEGFGEYETKMGAIQTIMASTGEPLENINEQLDRLNVYADKTKYVFSDMTKNIGKFTNAGVKLEPAVNAIKGISNLAALSGANAEQASHAMYNFAQSLSQGYVGLIDWKSINVAGMDTKEFKQELIDMGLEMGTLVKIGDKYKTTTTNAKGEVSDLFDATTGWNQALQFQWITTDVLTDTLNRYADTTTEIGQKATEAATKIYKFTEMTDALKETVGSGWAKTWELMLGDFNEAANLWTKIYKFFNDIFEDQANARNTLIETWKNSWGGAEQIQAIVDNVLAGIKGLIGQFREAWRSVFPPKTPEDLQKVGNIIVDLTARFKKWTTESDTLKRALTIVFKILKVGVSIFKIAWSVVKGIIEVLKPIGSLLLRIFEIIDGFLSGIFGSFSDDESVDTVTKITNGITKAFDFLAKNLRKAVDWILDAMADSSTAVEFGKNIISHVKTFFGKIRSAISTGFTEMGGLSGIGAKISEIWKDATNAVKGGFGSFVDWIKNFASNLKESNIGTLLDALNFGGIIIVAANIKKGLTVLKDGVKAFKSLSEQLTGILKGVKKVLFGFAKKLQAEANDLNATALLKVAGALAIFVGALIALTFVEKEKLNDALAVISVLGLVLMGLITALNNGNTVPAALKKLAGGLASMMKSIGNLAMATALTTFAIGLLALLGVIKLYASMDFGTLISGVAKLGIAFFVIKTVMTSMSKSVTGDAKQIRALAKVFVTLSIAALILSAALKILSSVPWETIGKFGALFLGMTLVFVTGIRMLQNVRTKTIETITKGIRRLALSFMFMSAAILLLVPALIAFTILAKLGGWDGFKLMAATIGVLTVAMIGLGVAVRIMGDNAKYFTKIALGIGLLVAAIVAIALVAPIIISSGDKIKDALIILVTAICDTLVATADKIVGALFAVLNVVLSNLEENIPKIADSLLKIIIGILDAVARYTPELVEAVYNIVKKIVEVLKQKIGDAPIDPKALMITVMSLMGLVKVINMMAKAKSSIKDAKKVLPLMLILLAAIAGVFGLMALMGVDGSTVRDQAIAVGMVMIALAISMGQLSKVGRGVNAKKILPMILSLALMIGAVFAVIGAFQSMQNLDGNKMIKQGIAISLVLLSVSFIMKNASKISGWSQGVGILAAIGSIALIIGALVLMFNQMKDLDSSKMIGQAFSLGLIIVALGFAVKMMSKSDMSIQNGVAIGIQLIALGAVMSIATANLTWLNDLDGDKTIKSATALGLIIVALGFAVKLMGKSRKSVKSAAGTAIELGALCVALFAAGGALIMLDELKNTDDLLIKAAALSLILEAIAIAARILPQNGSDIKSAAGLAVTLGALCVALFAADGALILLDKADIKTDGLIEKAGALAIILESMALAARTVSGLDPAMAAKGAAALDAVAIIITALIAVFAGLQEATGGGFSSFLEKGIDVLITLCEGIGKAIGALIGGILGGILEGLASSLPSIGKDMSTFIINLRPFLDECDRIGNNSAIGDGVSTIVDMLLKFMGAELLNTLKDFLSFFLGGSNLSSMSNTLKTLGPAIGQFVTDVVGTNTPEAVKTAGLVGQAVADLIDAIPNEGGLAELIKGRKNLESIFKPDSSGLNMFGHMGKGLLDFQKQSEGIDASTVALATNCGKTILEFVDLIPKVGGIVQLWTGETDWWSFIGRMPQVGKAIVEFQNNTKGVDSNAVETAKNAGTLLAELSKKLENAGGVVGWWSGETDYDGFYVGMPKLGYAIKTFAEKVDGVDTTAVNHGKNAGELLIALQDKLGKDGGLVNDIVDFFTGTFDPDKFKKNIVGLGEAVKAFNDATDGVDIETVNKGKNAVETLLAFQNLDADDMTYNVVIGSLGEQLKALGDGFAVFASAVESVNIDLITDKIDAIRSLAEISERIKGLETSHFTAFTTGMKNLAVLGLVEFKSQFENSEESVNDSIKALLNKFIAAIELYKPFFISNIESLVSDVEDKFKNLDASTAALMFVKNFESGVESNIEIILGDIDKITEGIKTRFSTELNINTLKTTGENIITNLSNGFMSTTSTNKIRDRLLMILNNSWSIASSYKEEFHLLGSNIIKNFIDGMNEQMPNIIKTADGLAQAALMGMQTTLDEHSPSDKTFKMGEYFTEGFVNGAVSLKNVVSKEVKSISNESLKIISSIFDNIENREWRPSISPVIDTNNIEEGLGWMNQRLNNSVFRSTMSPAIAQAMNISTTLDESKMNAHLASEIDNLGGKLDRIPSDMDGIMGELANLRDDINEMTESMSNLKVVMNSGAVVGQISKDMDKALGKTVSRAIRRR